MPRFASMLRLLRPRQWTKNAFVLAPVIFAREYGNPAAWFLALSAAVGFLLLSGMVYILNDLRDREEDRLHPVKKKRPLASGEVTPVQACILGALLALAAMWVVERLPSEVSSMLMIYALGNIAYTLFLKHIAIVDVLALSSFYVLRVLAGCYAIEVVISPWIVLTTFLLAMFLAFGKRYHEMSIEGYAQNKGNLQNYSRDLLDRLVTICAAAALLTYAIYAAEMARSSGDLAMVYTVAFVAFGLFRYLQMLLVFKQGGEPEVLLIKDPLMLLNMAGWLATCLWAMR